MRSLILVLLLLLCAPSLRAQETSAVRGQVSSEATGAPLPYATVQLLGAGHPRTATTDSVGRYHIADIPLGRLTLRATHPGHAPMELEVLIGAGEMEVDVALALVPVALAPVEVQVASLPLPTDTATVPAPELAMAGARALESSPGLAELGIGQPAGAGATQEPIDPSDVLYVRGSAADLKLVLLDGAPVYAPFHLGGLIPTFESGLLGSAELYLGGAPARYDGGLSYVMDLRTRAGSGEVHSSGALDLLSARASLEGPLPGGVRFLAAGRGIHGLGAAPLVERDFPYRYVDGVARVDVPLGGGLLTATGFRNREAIMLDSLGPAAEDEEASWANRAMSLRYLASMGNTGAELTAAFGAFDAFLPFRSSGVVLAHGSSHRARLAADFAREVGPVRFRFGASYDRLRLRYRIAERDTAGEVERSDSRTVGESAGGYMDASWQPLNRLSVRGGVRADLFAPDLTGTIAPRLAATWLLSDRAALTLAGGQYHQHVRPPEHLLAGVGPEADDTAAVPVTLSVARASHLSLGLDQELGDDLRLGLEGFFKRFNDLPSARGGAANASGIDIWVRRGAGSVRGWIGYSLAWIWQVDDKEPVANRFAGRQLLNTGLQAALGSSTELGLRVVYGAGLPYTAISLTNADASNTAPGLDTGPGVLSTTAGNNDPPLGAAPDEPYLRVDLDLSRTWSRQWNGRRIEWTPYLRVLNALDRRDALFFHFDPEADGRTRALSALPLLPVVGIDWKF